MTKMDGIETFKSKYGLSDSEVTLFPYGSYVYKTHNDRSDRDFLAVVPNNHTLKTGEEFFQNNVNIHVFSRKDWQNQLDLHKVHTLEAYFLPDGICKSLFKFKINLETLRHEFSQKASNSFVKAKKKIEKENDFYVGWKSLFHSLRILNFGIQISKEGKIIDYSAANQHWFDIRDAQQYNWPYFKEKYQPIYNELATEFRKAAPK